MSVHGGDAGDSLKVALGAGALLAPLTGIGQYALHLALGLQSTPGVDLTCFYGAVFSREVVRNAPAAAGRLRVLARRVIPNAYGVRRTLEQWRFDAGCRERRFDVYHEPNYLGLRFDGPTVITAHDLSWIRFPETHPVERVRAMERYFEPALKRAALVLTDSEFVKAEVMQEFGLAPGRIQAIPLGVDPVFRPMDAAATQPVLQPLGLVHGRYLLCVGTLEPRKNIEAALAAYGKLPQALRRRLPLVLAGMRGWRTSRLEKLLEPLVASGEARVLGYLERSQLAAVTAGATALVYPSLYEGFGLPPLEAMGCGVPPVISTAGSLQEVVADCGLMNEAHDIDGLAASMERIATDDALRAGLSRKSLQRAGVFSWERCVAETVAAYRVAAATSR